MSVYAFREAPTYRGATPAETFRSALDMPLSPTSTFFDQAKGGILESFGLGTAVRDLSTPEGDVERDRTDVNEAFGLVTHPLVHAYRITKDIAQSFINDDDSPAMSEDAYKSSAYFREGVPWDQAMTEDRAASLAESFDAKKVREYYGSKRPITAFIGNLAGQATDPINYIPIAGPAVKATMVARLGKVAGASVTASLDAAANTAIFGLATAGQRARYGDDVSWQTTVSQIATAALIGSAFGAIGGALDRSPAAASRASIEERLATLKTTQEARIALNEGIDAMVRGEDINLSPNVTEPAARIQQEIIAYHGSPHTFDRFSMDKIGTGEGAQAYGRGLYFAEREGIAISYRNTLSAAKEDARQAAKAVLDKFGERNAAIEWMRQRAAALKQEMPTAAAVHQKWEDGIHILESGADLSDVTPPGSLYEVGIKADPDDFLDWDKPLSGQTPAVQARVRAALGDIDDVSGQGIHTAFGLKGEGGDFKQRAATAMKEAGIPGIKYLDQGSRSVGQGSRNLVVFDDAMISIRSRDGQPIDTTPARPEPPPEGRKEAEGAVAKPDDYKALANQYRVDPETGTFDEEADIAQLGVEGRLTEEDVAVLADAQNAYDDGAAYGEALKSVAGCLI